MSFCDCGGCEISQYGMDSGVSAAGPRCDATQGLLFSASLQKRSKATLLTTSYSISELIFVS